MTPKIFINYRRDDASWTALALKNELLKYFPPNSIFKDFANIKPGYDFVKGINESLENCNVLLVIMGDQWINLKDTDGNRKIDNPDDFVRLEIAAALKRNIKVIPVLFNTTMPRSADLPEDLRALTRIQAVRIDQTEFELGVFKLINSIKIVDKAEPDEQVEDEGDYLTSNKDFNFNKSSEKTVFNTKEEAETNTEHTSTQNTASTNASSQQIKKNVFISYNHDDAEIAERLKEKLIEQNINVTIDSEKMEAGGDIKDFIEKSVGNTQVTIALISKKSLMSAWCAMESVNTFYHEKSDAQKKFIACYIDDDFFKRDFTDNALDVIEAQINELRQLIKTRFDKGRSTRDLNNELDRVTDLRNNMDDIIRRLRESFCIDIRENTFNKNFSKIVNAINNA